MKIKNEIKIAFVAILGVVVLFFGMQFLKGTDMFSSDVIYKMRFDDISGLSSSSPVYANGFRIGNVKNIKYDYKNRQGITVDVAVDKDMQIPEGTKAEIVSDMLGNVKVNLMLGNSSAFLQPGGVIDGSTNGGVMGELMKMVPSIQAMMPKLDSILLNLNTVLADPAIKSSLHNVNKITYDLTTSTRQVNMLLANMNKEIPGLTGKTNNLLNHASGTMLNANLLVGNLNQKIDSVNVSQTLAKVNKTLENVQQLTEKLNSDKGTLGMLMNDKQLYTNLTKTIGDLDSLMIDLKQHPKRYVHFSVF